MRGLRFDAAADARLVAGLHKDASGVVVVDVPGRPARYIDARVNENRAAFSLKVGPEFLDTMEGKAALFYMSDAAFKSIPANASLLWGGERWLVSADIEENRQGVCVERIVLCDGGLFPHLCDVWQTTTPIIDNRPQPPVYTLVKANQICFYQFTPNVDLPITVGRDNDANADTRDTVHFPYDAPVTNGGWIVDRTPRDRKTPGSPETNSYGNISRIQGAPEYTQPSALRRIGKLTVKAMVDPKAPAVIRAAV